MDTTSWQAIDAEALLASSTYKKSHLSLIEALQRVEAHRVHDQFGLSMHRYATERLNLSEDDAFTLLKVARMAKAMPAIKTALCEKKVTVQKIRRLSSVMTEANQSMWLQKASTLPQRALEREVAKVDPKTTIIERTRPVASNLYELTCPLSESAEKLLRRAMDLESQRQKRPVKLGETLESVLKSYIERHDPVEKANRALAKPKKSGTCQAKRTRHIPAQSQHVVMASANGQCSHVDIHGTRCINRRWLQRHHRHEYSKGGGHNPENLRLLCYAHHRQEHLPTINKTFFPKKTASLEIRR